MHTHKYTRIIFLVFQSVIRTKVLQIQIPKFMVYELKENVYSIEGIKDACFLLKELSYTDLRIRCIT